MTRKHNYRKKIEKLVEEHKMPTTPGVYILHIYHDPWCNFHHGGECNCNPDLELHPVDQKDKDQL
jgi:hypothetical protein